MKDIVLLVDDDDNVLHGLARALRRQPYQIYTSRSGDEAIAILKAHDVDVIVADEHMPGISGSDLLAWVAEHFPNVVRIVLTGQATAETAIRAINRGAVYQFLTKPCDQLRMAITIRKALEHKELLTENRRLLDEGRRYVSELESFTRELGILTSIVSQDLQEPLQRISRTCLSLGEQYEDIFDPKAKVMIDNALDATAEVERLVVDLLAHSHTKGPETSSGRPDSDQANAAPAADA